MNSGITLEKVGLQFTLYNNKSSSVKELFADLFTNSVRNKTETFAALSDINLTINHGDRLGIIGHNGAGKSSLLKILCKIYTPTTGSISIHGKVAPLLEIGAGFNPELSGRENIYLNGTILGYNFKKLKEIESEIIEFSELEKFIDMPVKYYSTGMYMKLAFSIATATKPDILILDELFAGGDADFIKKAQARMKGLIEDSNIMVFVSHQMELLEELCNRVIWVDHGKIIADGKPDEIINQYLKNES